MLFDTNLLIHSVRTGKRLPGRAILPVVVVGEIEAFALKADWGYQKVTFMEILMIPISNS